MERTNSEELPLPESNEYTPSSPDWTYSSTEKDYAAQEKEITLEKNREEVEGMRQDRTQRGKFSMRIFVFVCAYMVIALLLLCLSGTRCLNISDSVLIVMLTTTTANVIGLFVVVTNYLFHHK